MRTFHPHLGSFFFVLFLLSLRFGQIPSGLLQVILPRPWIGMVCTDFLYIGLNWNHFWDEALNLRINFYSFIYCGLFPLILVVFLCVVSSFTTFRPNSLWPSSSDFTTTSDRNAESCNRIPSNYCLPLLLSIAPRFWPSKPLAGLGRIWNRYLLTMLTWNRRDSTPLSAAPRCGFPYHISSITPSDLQLQLSEFCLNWVI